ncbi:hypothetical protein BC936DRAFT_141078 [Jimgerdemannia flammicorona]|uniref:Uncharacterized protein n=1 Tax=Jimgerdemannia flammicorona TaxID=994334 RepID=A0A433A306_9FUNG|nr:hypothetical protein BC936DRAFT_141078 [Jimgerdemannia flammicorona]
MYFDRPTPTGQAQESASSTSEDSRRSHTTHNVGDEWPNTTAASHAYDGNNISPGTAPPLPFTFAMPSDSDSNPTVRTPFPAVGLTVYGDLGDCDDFELIEDENHHEQERTAQPLDLPIGVFGNHFAIRDNDGDDSDEDGSDEVNEDDDDDDDDLHSDDIPSSYIPSSDEDEITEHANGSSGQSGSSVKSDRRGTMDSTATGSGSMEAQPSSSRVHPYGSYSIPVFSSSELPPMFDPDSEPDVRPSQTQQQQRPSSPPQVLPNDNAGGGPHMDHPYFTLPNALRVMYLGQATEQDRQIIFNKLSEGLAEAFAENASFFGPGGVPRRQTTAAALPAPRPSSPPPGPSTGTFKEKKHHILLLSLLPASADGDTTIDTCEDNGLSIIEADFTGDSRSSLEMGKNYANRQLADKIRVRGDDKDQLRDARFGGFVYPDETPNGIDLVIYFFAGDVIRELGASQNLDREEEERIEDDMMLLWRLSRLDVPVLIVLSSVTTRKGVRVTGESDDDAIFYTDTMVYPEDALDEDQGPSANGSETSSSPVALTGSARLANRRKEVVDLLTRYNIRCLNLTNPTLERPLSLSISKDESYLWNWQTPYPGRPANLIDHQVYTIPELSALDKHSIYCDLRYIRGLGVRAERIRAEDRKKAEEQVTRAIRTRKRRVLAIAGIAFVITTALLYLCILVLMGSPANVWSIRQRIPTRHRLSQTPTDPSIIACPPSDSACDIGTEETWSVRPTSLLEKLSERKDKKLSGENHQPTVIARTDHESHDVEQDGRHSFAVMVPLKTKYVIAEPKAKFEDSAADRVTMSTEGAVLETSSASEMEKHTTVGQTIPTVTPVSTTERVADAAVACYDSTVHVAQSVGGRVVFEVERAWCVVREEGKRAWEKVRDAAVEEKKMEGEPVRDAGDAETIVSEPDDAVTRIRKHVVRITTRARARSVYIVKNVKLWARVMQELAGEWVRDTWGVVTGYITGGMEGVAMIKMGAE